MVALNSMLKNVEDYENMTIEYLSVRIHTSWP